MSYHNAFSLQCLDANESSTVSLRPRKTRSAKQPRLKIKTSAHGQKAAETVGLPATQGAACSSDKPEAGRPLGQHQEEIEQRALLYTHVPKPTMRGFLGTRWRSQPW